MTPALILLTLCNLALWWRQHRRAQANHAEVWQAIARVKMQQEALALSSAEELRAAHEWLVAIDSDIEALEAIVQP